MSDRRERDGFLAFRLEPVGGLRRLPLLGACWAAFALVLYHVCTNAPLLGAAGWLDAVPPFWRMSFATSLRHAGYLCRLAAFVALASTLGRGLLRRAFRADGLNAWETFSFGFGLGLGVIGLSSLALGVLQQFKPAPVFSLAAILALAALWLNAAAPRRRVRAEPPGPLFPDRGCALMAALAAFLLLLEGFYAFAPETSYDAMVYHLALPSLYRLSGGLVSTPTNLYSGFPMLLEWAYGFTLFFTDEIGAKLIHWACGLGLAAAFLGLGLRARRPLMGWVACVVFLSAPLTAYNIVAAGVDVGSAYVTLLAAYAAALACADREDASGARFLDLAAVFCGLAMGIKYTAWPLLPVIAVALSFVKRPKRDIGRFALVAAVVLLPWALKNVYLYRNPLYPFLHGSLAPHAEFSPDWRLVRAEAGGRDWPAVLASAPLRVEALLHPWFITLFDTTHSGHVGPLFLMILPALLFVRPASAESRLWLACLFGLWMSWWPFSTIPRYFLPGLCLMSVYAGAVVEQTRDRRSRGAVLAVLAIVSLNGISTASRNIAKTGVSDYLVGGMSKTDFLRPSRPLWPNSGFNAAEWINRNTPVSARVLVLDGGRAYYVERPFLTSSRLDEDLLAHWLKRSRTPEDLLREFQSARVDYLLVNMAWLWGQAVPDRDVTPEKMDLLDAFFSRYTRLRYNDLNTALGATRWSDVYEIAPHGMRLPTTVKPLVRWYRSGGAAGLGPGGESVLEFDPAAR